MLNIKKPSTVFLLLPVHCERVEVFLKGELYFFREQLKGIQKIKFNLVHSGIYQISTGAIIKVTDIQINELQITLPEPDRNRYKKYKIVFNPSLTGSPARNFTAKGLIEVGSKFRKYPYPIRLFILLHEIGHFYYQNETNCDLFAAKTFIRMGYNNSNAYYSLSKVLHQSQQSNERLKYLYNALNKN